MGSEQAQSTAEESVSLQDILNPKSKVSSISTFGHILWLKKIPILIIWLVVGTPLAVFLAFYDIPKSYWTSVNLRFPKVIGAERSMAQDVSITELESIVNLFKSYNVMSKTINDLGLQFRVTTKNVFIRQVFEEVKYGEDEAYGNYYFTFAPDRKLVVQLQPNGEGDKVVVYTGKVPADNTVHFGGITVKILPSVLMAGDFKLEAMYVPMPYVIKDFQKRVGVKALDEETTVKVNYTIFLEDRDPYMVADILNELVKNFIAVYTGTTEVQDIKVLEEMEKNLQLARDKEKQAQDALAAFYGKNPTLTETRDQGNSYALVGAQTDKAKQQERQEELAQMMHRRPAATTDEQKRIWLLDAVNLLQSYGMVQVLTLQSQIRDLEAKKAQLTRDLSPGNPKVAEIDQMIIDLCPDADKLLAIAQATVEKRLDRLNKDIAGYLPKNVSVTADLEAKRLNMEKENASRVVENLRLEYDRAKLSTGGNFFKVNIVDQARPPEYVETNLKRRLLFSAGAFIFGLFPGLIWFIAQQVLFGKIWNRDDVTRKLRIKVLGTLTNTPSKSSKKNSARERNAVEDRLIYNGESSTLLQIENFRSVRAEVENFFQVPAKTGHTGIIVTSTQPFEGKSLFCANLAVSFARKKCRTLLIDADFRHGRQERIFNLENHLGFSDVLEEAGLNEEGYKNLLYGIMAPTMEHNLFLLPKGKRLEMGVEAITQAKINGIIALLQSDFEIVIVDTPPVIVAADAFNLMKVVPNVVFVVRSGMTSSTDAEEALDMVRNRGVKVGCVVNAVQESPFIKNHYSKYGYYYVSG